MPSPYYERQKAELKAAIKPKDYSGHIPKPDNEPWHHVYGRSPIRDLVDDMVAKTDEAREKILRDLIENPGVVATFGEDFVVEFGDLEIRQLHSPELDHLNEYGLELSQKWRIRRRKEEDDRSSLGGDSRGEERTSRQDSGEEQQETPGLRLLP